LLLLQFFNVSMGIISLKDQVVDLLLEELNDRVALGDYSIPVKNSLLTCCDNLLLLRDQGLKLYYLSNLSISILIVTLSYANQLTHTTA
jgi:hypothetical protein